MGSGRSAEFLTQPRAEWVADAACRNRGITDTFFVERGEAIWAALVYCERCPVRKQCLQYALDNGIEEGVWGGKSPRARRDPERCAEDVRVPTAARVVALWEQRWTKRRIAKELGVSESTVWVAIRRHQGRAS